MQFKEKQPLSIIDILTRNLFLLTIMCICIGLGIVVHLLNNDSFDTYLLQIKSERLDFIFFMGFAACYIPLIFIFKNGFWTNFFLQLIASLLLFVLLLFLFSPPLKINSYLFSHHVEFNTRSWEEFEEVFIGKVENFPQFEQDHRMSSIFLENAICPTGYSYYFLTFVLTYYCPAISELQLREKKMTNSACCISSN